MASNVRKRTKTPELPHDANQLIEAIATGFPHFAVEVLRCPPKGNYICVNLSAADYPQLLEVRKYLTDQGWFLVERHLSRRFQGQIAALFPGFRLVQTERSRSTITAKISYARRGEAKLLGFTWNPTDKNWTKELPTEDLGVYLPSLTFEYSIGHKPEVDYAVVVNEEFA